ncbi:carboxypeptidase-like regulatory domain-containing protein [Deefgea rivuli]|uniref:carboxypeptidase-like regulatory domain-containing protein n=1 Tax=Deefgea rivuli TaxID=400948 RepID=UPI0004810E85|nr:carboxypeptidase-like regulatory domain-containing protein [Deefgea rivuli]
MNTFSSQQKLLVVLLASALSACGGGGSDSSVSTTPATPATPAVPVAVNAGSLKGSVAIGSALANAKVEVKDAKGVIVSTSTDAKGAYSLSTAALTAPFIIRVTGGTVVTTGAANTSELYSSSVSGETSANVSTLTTLLIAQMSQQLPADAFAKFTDSKALLAALNDKAKIDLAITALTQYIAKELGIDISKIGNPVTASLDPIASGNAYDALLEKLKEADPNIINKAIAVVKAGGGTVTINPATETLGQCIASLSLPADLKIVDSTEPAAAIYEWNGNKSVDWTGQQKFREGWFGGLFKTYYGKNASEAEFNGEKVLRRFDETYLNDDLTGYAVKQTYPQKFIFNWYTSLDSKYRKGWQEDTFDKDNKLTEWHKKFEQTGAQTDHIYDITATAPLKTSVSRKSLGSWYSPANVARTETFTEEVVFLGRETVPTLMGKFETCKSKNTTKLVQKDATGKVTVKETWTTSKWHVPKLGYVKNVTTDSETDESGKVVYYTDTRTYDIIAARNHGKRYGAYDVWSGRLTGTGSSATPASSACDYNNKDVTVGNHWLVDTAAKKLHYWNGTAVVDTALNYPGTTEFKDFRSETYANGGNVWSQTLIFNADKTALTGSYTRKETQKTPISCSGTHPSSINASKIF